MMVMLPRFEEEKFHGSALCALKYMRSLGRVRLNVYREAFSSEHSGTMKRCHEALSKILDEEVVSDREVLGLAWMIMEMEKESDEEVESG